MNETKKDPKKTAAGKAPAGTRKKNDQALSNTDLKIMDLACNSLENLENDRRVLARELHDGIGGTLAAIVHQLQMRIAGMGRPPAGIRMSLENIAALLLETINHARELSRRLRPTALDDFGLTAAIRDDVLDFKRANPGTDVRLQIVGSLDDIPERTATALYRTAQELITNVDRHSRADHMSIRLARESRTLHLVVRDNGGGFDSRRALRNMRPDEACRGLRRVKERLEICGGSLRIVSRPGWGTRIEAAVPLT